MAKFIQLRVAVGSTNNVAYVNVDLIRRVTAFSSNTLIHFDNEDRINIAEPYDDVIRKVFEATQP